MNQRPSAEDELKDMTRRFWDQVDMTDLRAKERNEAAGLLKTIRFHLRRNDHIDPLDGVTATNQILDRIDKFFLDRGIE